MCVCRGRVLASVVGGKVCVLASVVGGVWASVVGGRCVCWPVL